MYIPKVTVPWAADTADKLRKVENFLPKSNPYVMLLDPKNKFFEVDNVGLIAVLTTDGWTNLAHVHITFWDQRLRGREGLCRSLAEWVTRFTDKVLFTQIPEDRRALVAFATRVGFVPQANIGPIRTLIFTNYSE